MFVLWACSWLLGCAGGPDDAASQDDWGTVEQEIIGGEPSPAEHDSVVLLQGPGGLCTGTLLAPNLVLTARHCISESDRNLSCPADGSGESGVIHADFEPDAIAVFVGRDAATRTLAAHGARFLHDGASSLCNHDIAFIVLDRAVQNMPLAQIDLDAPVEPGDEASAVGWGLDEASQQPAHRLERTGIPLLDVGPSLLLPTNHMLVGESTCMGDSGGPLFAMSGRVIGVTSYGGNGDADDSGPASACRGPNAVAVFTRVSGFPALSRAALRIAASELANPSEA